MAGKRAHTPTILQMEATECGAAALAIILGYYGKYLSLEQLRIECGVSRDGSNAFNILEVARKYGLDAEGVSIEMEQLHELEFPAIAFWEFNHFVVLEGATANKIYINDPKSGPRTITYTDFDRAFTGVALLFELTKRFKPGGKKLSPYSSLWPHIKAMPGVLTLIILLSILVVIPGILIPAFSKVFIDDILIRGNKNWLLPLLWGLLFIGLLRALLSYLQQYYLIRLQLKVMLLNSAKFLWHVLRLPFLFFAQRFAGDIQARVASNDRIATWLTNDVSLSVVNLISMVFYVVIMLFYDWVLTLVSLLIALANASLLLYVNKNMQNNSSRLQQELGKLAGIEMFGLEAIESLKATSSENAFFQLWAGYHAQTLNSQQKIQLFSRLLLILPQFLNGVLFVLILGLGAWRIMQGDLTLGGLIAFQILLSNFNQPLLSLINLGSRMQQLRGDLLRLEDVNKYPEDIRFRLKKQTEAKVHAEKSPEGTLIVKDLTFGYSSLHPPLIEKLNLTIAPKQKIAIVGVSGSGKSTLAKLICGLYPPWSGDILWENQSIPENPAHNIGTHINFVDQDIFLFEGTIYDNLTLWNTTITDEAIKNSIKKAGLEELLTAHGHGLYAQILAGGSNFSSGQRQQLEIARALTTYPALLILDEATASLDAVTEQTIMENLKQCNCSLLVIAHRLSTIHDADEIIVLQNGKVVERGTNDQLFQQRGYYYQLMHEQKGG